MPENGSSVVIEKLAAGGAGLGRLEGKVVFVPYTLPGEEVEIRILREKKDYAQGRLLALRRVSPLRKDPVCPLFTRCGGCDLQHLGYEDQLTFKADLFREILHRIGRIELDDVPMASSSPFAYRNRVQVHSAVGGGGWGFKEASGNRIVPVESCPIVVPEINDFFRTEKKTVVSSVGGRFTVFGWGGRWYADFAMEDVGVELLGKTLKFSPACFFQSNLLVLEDLIRRIQDSPSGGFALDLYGGVGTFGLFLSDRFDRVVTVEENPLSAFYAERNLPRGRAEVFPGSVEKWLSSRKKKEPPPDLVLVDPPRTGLSSSVKEFLRREHPPEILYVSCDVATLARDLRFLLGAEYLLSDYRIFDFYPQTAHMESLCRLVAS